MIVLVSSLGVDTTGEVIREADQQGRPVIVGLFGPNNEAPKGLLDRPIIRAEDDDLEDLADQIVDLLNSWP